MTRNFRVHILLRILFITVLIGLLIYFFFVDERYLRTVYLAAFLAIAIGELMWYIDKTHRDFTTFLLALLQDDFTTKFSEENKGGAFDSYYKTLNQITRKFEQISSDKEVQHLYLEALVDHVRVGILSIDKDEKIHLMNGALQRMLGKPPSAFLKNLSSVDPQLPQLLREIKPKENRLLKVHVKGELLHLSIHASEFILDKNYYKLISIQNIKNELDNNELEAWQKLIRVLTHEIMNSVTPITSLSGTLQELVKDQADSETLDKVRQGLGAIQLRSEGLQNFTEAYRKLTKIPRPKFNVISLSAFITNNLQLLENDLKDIRIVTEIPPHIEILGDRDLLSQVLINLLKNAVEAMTQEPEPTIWITAEQADDVVISIRDNGSGIDEDKIEQIFIPFFTTKSEGSGIGLALSRQIIQLHNGSIQVHAREGQGTTFIIKI